MRSLISVPYTKCFIRIPHIRQESQDGGTIEGYIVAVRCVLNEAPKLIVMTAEGAMFDSVPPQAICFWKDATEKHISDVCPWDCLADKGEIVELEFVRRWTVQMGKESGRYLFTLHFDPTQSYGRDPVQQKMFHFIEGFDGN